MRTYKDFIIEATWHKSKKSSNKSGSKSGKSSAPLDIKMIGMPGSGKSTMAKRLASATGGKAHGYDDARKEIHGDHTNQGDFPKIHKRTMNVLATADKTKPRIQDNTNVNPKFKKSTDDALKNEAGFRNTVAVAPSTSQRASFRRNSSREKPVPKFVMRAMATGERNTLRTKEGKEARETGRELSKRFRLNRRSTGASLGVQRKRGRA